MKSIYHYFIIASMSVLSALTSCTLDELVNPSDQVIEGQPTSITLHYDVQSSPVYTRAAQETRYEYRVENLYVLVFDSNGNRIPTTDDNGTAHSFFASGSGLTVTNGDASSSGSVTFHVTTANNARIVGVANLHTTTTSTAYDLEPADLDAIQTLDALEALIMPLQSLNSVERGALFMMTGYAEQELTDNTTTTSISITGAEGGNSTLDCTLKLRRTDAKVTVNVTSEPSNTAWSQFSFKPKTWQVMRVPNQSLLLPFEKTGVAGVWEDSEALDWDAGRISSASLSYFDTDARPFEVMNTTEVDNTKYYTGGSFVFYMPENRKRFKQEITETDATKAYALRDESNTVDNGDYSEKPGQGYENTDFKYANDNSTYLILTGALAYTDAQNYRVNADVRFIIHLGYASGNANDYDTKRNGHYTYNIKVTGVDNIIVEVTNENGNDEVRPGYEGNVVYSNNTIFELDSHYDRCLLEIPPSLVSANMTWGVNTRFSSGVYNQSSNSSNPFEDIEDYKWIKFAINKLHTKPNSTETYQHGEYVNYPGDINYNPGFVPDENTTNDDLPELLDIHQLVSYLKICKGKDGFDWDTLIPENSKDADSPDGHICITAFVDENIYTKHPVTGENNLALWKETVDCDRQLHIIIPFYDPTTGVSSDVVYSPDGNSSVVNSLYTFTQRAIRTIYNAGHTELETAWGLESVMEANEGDTKGGRLKVGDVSRGSDTRNGRENTLKIILGQDYTNNPTPISWTDVIKNDTRYGLNDNYLYATYACLLRNRDLDGDNQVDANEIHWYLASIDQLTDIYLGEFALDEASRLYPTNPADRPGGNEIYWHYTSSSYNNTDSAPWVLWAEEGASLGSYNGDYGSKVKNGEYYAYRCVRNLGISLDDVITNPEDLVDVTYNEDGTYTIDLTRMNSKARRTNLERTQLPAHNERSENNKPYAKFNVHQNAYGGYGYTPYLESTGHWNDYPWNYFQTTDVCPDGYRIPNQRELLIMATRMPDSAWPTYSDGGQQIRPNYISQTSFSMDGKTPYTDSRDGYLWSSDTKTFFLQNSTAEEGYVRPIQDTD